MKYNDVGLEQEKALKQIKKERKIDQNLRDGVRLESPNDPVDTKTAMETGQSSMKNS